MTRAKHLMVTGVAFMSVATLLSGSAALAAGSALKPATVVKKVATQAPTKLQLAAKSGTAVDVQTEADCTNHMLTAKVTNKTKGTITPDVTFNNQTPRWGSTQTIKPGETAYYLFAYSGNNLMVDVKVAVDTYAPLKLSPALYCTEPVTFMVTGASKSAVVGTLTNNSSLVAQTVLTRVGTGDIRTESLQPGESRLIAMPFTAFPGQTSAYVSIGTTAGYQGNYEVDLTEAGSIMLPLSSF